MSTEFSNETTSGYFFRQEYEYPQPAEKPVNEGGGGLPGDPEKPDYVTEPEPADPPDESVSSQS